MEEVRVVLTISQEGLVMSKKGRLTRERDRFANLIEDTIGDFGETIPGMHHIRTRFERDRRKRSVITHEQPNKSIRRAQ